MAPFLDSTNSENEPTNTKKHNIYSLEEYPAEAVQYYQEKFQTAVLPTDPEAQNWRANAESILVRELTISADDVTGALKLRAIGKQGTGIDIIDGPACDARSIPILNTPGVNAASVAELVLALALAVRRQLQPISVGQAAGREVRKEHCSGNMMAGRPVGVVGMGAVCTLVARMFRAAFGCPVFACDPFTPADAWADIPHTRVGSIDVLTLHVPLTEQTRGLIGLPRLRAMRKDAVVINVARGGIIVEDDLLQALEEGLIAGAGLDCHEEEPLTLARYQKLWDTGKVISTPYIGATTVETQSKTAKAAIDRVYAYLNHEDS
ncbi:D-3-phosphoglycerate dehydrogenase-like protein [Pestalotiopsis sp. NC0098]|nr:D-3-phosphoglycerate dehydrogenase-like protein [Pestalotiopsis sp. NC0098]